MTDEERARDWVRFYEASPPSYKPWALKAVLTNDGEAMYRRVEKALKLTLLDVVKAL